MEKLKKKTQDIIRKAFDLWDIKDWNPADIDPLVKLLFAACANESLHLESLIEESTHKTKDSLIRAFLPPAIMSAKPACAMASACPLEPTLKINNSFVFQYDTFITKDTSKEPVSLLFSPFIESQLLNLKPKFKYDGHSLFCHKDASTHKPANKHNNTNSIWIGFELNDNISSLEGLPVFLSIKEDIEIGEHVINEFNFYENTALYYENEKMDLVNGFAMEQFFEASSRVNNSLSYNTLSYLDVLKESLYYFEDGYFQLAKNKLPAKPWRKRKYPDMFETAFDEETLEVFSDDLLWFEFRFDMISPEEIQKISICLNAFPVFNIKETTVNLTLEEPIQQLPLAHSEDLIAITGYAVYDEYYDKIESASEHAAPFVVRDMLMEKFSGFDLHELLDTLIDKFQTDHHAFQENFNVSADDINRLREAMKPIHSEKLKAKASSQKNKIYAILNKGDKKGIASVELSCCLTNGESGNQIKSGERLIPANSLFVKDSAELLTKTMGGRDQLKGRQRSGTVRNLIVSNNQIITTEDIKNFCFSELGAMLTDISINESVMKGEFGLKKCILVKIALDPMLAQSQNLRMIRKNLESKIKRKSSIIVPVVVNLSFTQH